MKADLEPAKNILRTFLEEFKNVQTLMSPPLLAGSFTIKDKMPIFDESDDSFLSDDFCEKENAYMLLYADPWNFRSLMHMPKPNPMPEYYNELALPVYELWRSEEKEVFYRKCEQIPTPSINTSLADYLQQLALAVSEGNEKRDVWIESLRCFLQFLRDDAKFEDKGFLERLFPSPESCKGMVFKKNYTFKRVGNEIKKVECQVILRKIEPTVYPIDIFAASEIIKNLIKTVLQGRPNSQHSAAQALGFTWLCHAVGCYRLTTQEKLVFSAKISNLKDHDLTKPKERLKPTHFIGIQSLFGIIDVPISKFLHDFLLALPRESYTDLIFNMDLDTVSRTFRNKGVKQSPRAKNLGPITFLTFMSQPTEAEGHRPFHT